MKRWLRNIVIAFMVLCVILPLVPLVIWSFTEWWPFGQLWPDPTLKSWLKTLSDPKVLTAMRNSLLLCVTVVPISLALSFYAAKNLGTRRFRGRRAIQLMLLVPSFVPQIALVFGMQRVFSRVGLYNNFQGIVVALLVFYVPYMTLLLSAVFENYDMDYEYQALSLGVSRWHILWHVTLPQVRSGVIVTCIFSFIGVWSAYLVVSAMAPPTFRTMSLLAFPMMGTAAGGYALAAAVTLLYIAPILAILVVFSKLLVNDDTHVDAVM